MSPTARAEIEAALPHRSPFLFVDEIADEGDTWIETRWTVPADADWFQGHYPGRPITPGVLICEHAFQSAALWVARREAAVEAGDRGVPVLTRIEGARFRRIVEPGELLETRATLEERTGPAFRFSAQSRCAGSRVVRVDFVVASTGGLAALGA